MGGVSICGLDSYAQSPSAVGVPDDAYIFSVSGPGINSGASGVGIYYSTSTQQNLNAPKIWDAAANKFYYYVPASESPVSFYLATYTTLAFKSIVNETKGTSLSYSPQAASLKTSAVKAGDVVAIAWDTVDNVKTGTLTFTCDDPSQIRLLSYVGGYYFKYSSDDFKGNTLTVKYDPTTELSWTVAQTGSKTPFKATLNGSTLQRKNGMVFNSGNTYDYTNYYTVSLEKGSTTNDVVVTTQWPDFEFPTSIKIVQDGGNETNAAKLQEKITKVSVGGVALDRSAWEGGKTFMVKNGATVSYTLAQQYLTQFVVSSRTLNGNSIGTSTSVTLEGETATPQNIEIHALVNNNARFTVNCENYQGLEVTRDGYYVHVGSPSYEVAVGTYNTDFPLTFKGERGYQLKDVKVDGKTYTAVNNTVTINNVGMDKVYDVNLVPYERTQDFSFTVGQASGGQIRMVLAPNDPSNSQTIYANVGANTIKVNPADFPIQLGASNGSVYVNGTKQTPDENGYFLSSVPASGSDVRIYDSQVSPIAVKLTNKTSYSVTATVDGKAATISASGSTVNVLPGAKVVLTTTAAGITNSMLQTGDNAYLLGSGTTVTYTANADCDLIFRPKALVSFDFGTNYTDFVAEDTYSGKVYKFTANNQTIMLPYKSGTTWTLKVYDPTNKYTWSAAKCTGTTTSFSQNVTDQTVTVSNGAAVAFTVSKNPNPYYLNIRVVPNNGSNYEFDAESGKYLQWSTEMENYTSLVLIKNGESAGGEGGSPYRLQNLLRIGCNNVNRDYTINASYGQNNSFQDYFNLKESDFPLTIVYAPSVSNTFTDEYKYMAGTTDGWYYESIDQSNSYTIEKPEDGIFDIDITILAGGSYHESTSITFNDNSDAAYFCEVDGFGLEKVSQWNSHTTNVFSFSKIRIIPEEGQVLSKATYSYKVMNYYTGSKDFEPNAKGEIEFYIPSDAFNMNAMAYQIQHSVDVEFDMPLATVEFGDVQGVSLWMNSVDGSGSTQSGDKVKIVKGKIEFDYTVTGSSPYELVAAKDKATGKDLHLNIETMNCYIDGVEEGMTVVLEFEQHLRDKNLTVKVQGSSTTGNNVPFRYSPQLYLAYNSFYAIQESQSLKFTGVSSTAFTSVDVKFADNDLPLYLQSADYTNGGKTYQSEVFLNGEQIQYANGRYQFPTEMPDNSTMIIVRPDKANGQTSTVTASPMKLDSADLLKVGLEVNGSIAVEDITSDGATFVAPVTSVVKVVDNGSLTEYNVRYTTDGTNWKDMPADGATISLGDKVFNVEVSAIFSDITFNANSGTDLTSLKVVDQNGKEYDITGGNVVFTSDVKSLKITSTEPDTYLTMTSSVSGMAYDKDSGELTGLTSGTMTVTANKIVRDNDVMVFLDSDEQEGNLILGFGKVTEKTVSLAEGFQDIKFAEVDLPILYRTDEVIEGGDELAAISTFSIERNGNDEKPSVYMNGNLIEYSAELGGYLFPEEAFSSEENSVIKIYAPNPAIADEEGEGVKNITLFYLVEPGITFKAIEDYSVEVTESGMREVLPSTYVELEAQTDNGEPLFVEVDGERVEATDGKYLIQTGNSDVTIAVKVEKLNVTVISEDAWQAVRVTGNGFSYPMYDATSELQFPASTKSLQLFTEMDGYVITSVTDDAGQAQFNAVTGELTNIKSDSKLTLVMGEYNRDVELLVYVEDLVENNQISHVVLSEGKSVVKNVALAPGYQTVMIHKADLPLAVTTTAQEKAKVYVNNELLEEVDGKYQFPDELPAKSIVKIYSEEQYKISVEYTIDLRGYDFKVWHDRQQDVAINTADIHEVLPGTEISFTLTPQAAPEALAYNAIRTMADEEETDDSPAVTINDEPVTPDENGVYTLKVNDSHINGISIKAISPEVTNPDIPTGVEAILADGETANVYDLNGTLILKNATTGDLKKLPAGIYIINGEKHLMR